jgi:CRP/FNR family transcriptional regulator, cyclic AMP receptor protein
MKRIAAPRHSLDEKRSEGVQGADVCRALLASGIFRKTDPDVVSALSRQLKPVRFPPNHVVGAQSDYGGRIYVIISGKVKVVHWRPGGCELALTILGSSEIFGGTSLFDPASCETSVTTLTEVQAVPIERDQLLIWMAEYPELSAQVLRLFARWAKAATNALVDLASADFQSRVARRLLLLMKRFGRREGDVVRVVHDLTLDDLSLFAGVAPATISDTLRDFEDRGWIRLEDNSLVVVDSQALASVRPESVAEVCCVRSI